jgi:hypothetical protein
MAHPVVDPSATPYPTTWWNATYRAARLSNPPGDSGTFSPGGDTFDAKVPIKVNLSQCPWYAQPSQVR